MRNKFFLCLFVLVSLTACKDTKWVEVPGGMPPEGAITGQPGVDDPAEKTLINCQYIGGDPFELNRIPVENLIVSNDLIYLAARPYANGDIAFDLPINDATFTGGVSHEATYEGRSGVIKFDGTGKMNGKDGFAFAGEGEIGVVLDTHITPELKEEGYVREVLSKVQNMRKDKGFEVLDKINLYVSGNEMLENVIKQNAELIKHDTLAVEIVYDADRADYTDTNINGENLNIDVEVVK